ncbi:hypothetical protein FLJC2902T_00250 [Flavobacterium limnosediminis JC2902]|uniref:Uncharacterized protein n=1 Tax=Flavobacterium limnosediminis JC2902 TaxID=1341181 RepID=V6SYR7_9FLAO|nr:hypothetical protein FLJC2902T_00250 [Flavobacterium limnosediminis JC2902]
MPLKASSCFGFLCLWADRTDSEITLLNNHRSAFANGFLSWEKES